MERSVDGVIIEVQTGDTIIDHITDIPQATVVFPTGLVLLAHDVIDFIAGLGRNQTIGEVLEISGVKRTIVQVHFNVDVRRSCLTGNIQCSHQLRVRRLRLQEHIRQSHISRLAVSRADSGRRTGFQINLILHQDDIAFAVNIQLAAILDIDAVAIQSIAIASDFSTGNSQMTRILYEHSARSAGTDRLIVPHQRIVRHRDFSAGSDIQSRTAVIHRMIAVIAIQQLHIIQQSCCVLHIQQTGRIGRTGHTSQSDIMERYIRTVNHFHQTRTRANHLLACINQRIIVTVDGNSHICIIQRQCTAQLNIAGHADFHMCGAGRTSHFNGVGHRHQRSIHIARATHIRTAVTRTGNPQRNGTKLIDIRNRSDTQFFVRGRNLFLYRRKLVTRKFICRNLGNILLITRNLFTCDIIPGSLVTRRSLDRRYSLLSAITVSRFHYVTGIFVILIGVIQFRPVVQIIRTIITGQLDFVLRALCRIADIFNDSR